ncbi:MAG: hypothetical protein K0S68_736 [Candidatus Saccharibacteria bacterium]|nr:hypothetical protein [Candidatus Saccharibacteria bacterium]
MIEPNTFGFDEQTAKDNKFQHHLNESAAKARAEAMAEWHTLFAALREFGVDVVAHTESDGVPRPNGVYPNNWISMWPDGRVFLYPMATESRRVERTRGVLKALRERFEISGVEDLTAAEDKGRFLESTGAMVFDHGNKVAYACESVRCDGKLFERHVLELGYEPVLFQAFDEHGTPIYHTNVMMGVQSTTAVVCLEAVRAAQRRELVASLERTGHEVVDITFAQLDAYCGNVIELANGSGERCLLLSKSAYDAFTPAQRKVLGRDKTLLPVAVPTIQAVGGGSVRCMVAEVFLPALVGAR